MNLTDITPLILTFNEEANLRDTLQRINWASQILMVDSGSTDQTLSIAAEFPQVRVIQRRFDHFADQCNFGLEHIETPWVLSLDADYRCGEDLPEELRHLDPELNGYRAAIRYGISGDCLRATLYPPRTVLYRRTAAMYHRDGHAHRVAIEGPIGTLCSTILHDDYKPLSVWLNAQTRYANLEAEKLLACSASELTWKDRVRKTVVLAPILTALYCLFAKGLILDGWRGIYYTFQRVYAELLLSLVLVDYRLRSERRPRNNVSQEMDASGE